MKTVEPSGDVLVGVCGIQGNHCVAKSPAPVMVVFVGPTRQEVKCCRICLEEEVDRGEWTIEGYRKRRAA